MKKRVFVSSTSIDLMKYRQAVRDAFNDADIMSVAGYSVAYPPRDRETEDITHASVLEDDL